jgi:hypothetical protein
MPDTDVKAELLLAREVIEDERAVMFDSNVQVGGKYKGQVIDTMAKDDIARMDEALAGIDRVIATLTRPQPSPKVDGLVERIAGYVANYEFRGDGGDYTPNEAERAMLEDALNGFITNGELH